MWILYFWREQNDVFSGCGRDRDCANVADVDVVDLDSGCNEELRAEIERDGVILYEAG